MKAQRETEYPVEIPVIPKEKPEKETRPKQPERPEENPIIQPEREREVPTEAPPLRS